MPTSTHVHSSTGSDAKQTQVKHNPSNSLVAHASLATQCCLESCHVCLGSLDLSPKCPCPQNHCSHCYSTFSPQAPHTNLITVMFVLQCWPGKVRDMSILPASHSQKLAPSPLLWAWRGLRGAGCITTSVGRDWSQCRTARSSVWTAV